MPLLQTFKCDVNGCDVKYTELRPGDGAPSWGMLQGVVLHPGELRQVENPTMCPKHLALTAQFVHDLRETSLVVVRM